MSSTEFFSTYFLPFSYSFMFPCDKICFLLYLRNPYTEQHLNEIDGKACVSPCQMVTLHAIPQTKLKDLVSNFISTIGVVGDFVLGAFSQHIFPFPPTIWRHFAKKKWELWNFYFFPSSTFIWCSTQTCFYTVSVNGIVIDLLSSVIFHSMVLHSSVIILL